MEYEVTDLEPGEGDGDILFTVSYWYEDFARGLGRKPHFVEHHYITGFRADAYELQFDEVGQIIGVDGNKIPSHVPNENGEWIANEVTPSELPPPVLSIDEQLMLPIEARAKHLKFNREFGSGLIPEDRRPKPSKKNSHFARRPEIASLRGHTKRL